MKRTSKSTFFATTVLVVLGALLLAGCTITPAAAPTTEAPTADTGIVASTSEATSEATAEVTAETTVEPATAATAAGEDTTGATGTVTSTTTVLTTTVTTVTEQSAVSETQGTAGATVAGAAVTTDTTGTAAEGAAATGLPTATPEAGSGAALTVTAPISTPAAAAGVAGTTAATTVVTDATAGTLMQVISRTPGLETLANVLTTSGVSTALEQPGPLTFFAPTNDAFAALPPGQLDALLADPTTLTPLLQYHIVIDNVSASHLGTLGTALSSQGLPITITVQADGSLLVNDARIVQPDIPAANGVIHLIDQVLVPPPSTP